MSFEVTLIRDVSIVLKDLLLQSIPGISVSLDLPNESSSGMGVSLFLYAVSENPYLKNQEFAQKGLNELAPPPMTLDLFYLVIPYSSGGPPSDIARENEQMILTAVMRTLYDNTILTGPQLLDSLIESGNTELRVIHNEISLDQMNQLWSMIRNTSYRLCASYLVTPLKVPSRRVIDTKRVTSKVIDFVDRGD